MGMFQRAAAVSAAVFLVMTSLASMHASASKNIEIYAGDVRWEVVASGDNVSVEISVVRGEIDVWVMPTPIYAKGIWMANWSEPEEMEEVLVYRNISAPDSMNITVEAPSDHEMTIAFDNRRAEERYADDIENGTAEVELTIFHPTHDHPTRDGDERTYRFWQLYAGIFFSVLVAVMAAGAVYVTCTGISRTYENEPPWDAQGRRKPGRRGKA